MNRKITLACLACLLHFALPAQDKDSKEENYLWLNPNQPMEVRVDAFVSALTLDEKIGQLSYTSPAISRLGVPEYNWWNECLHGVARNGRATVFPQAIGLVATFDKKLAFKVASAISEEARAKYYTSVKIGNRGQYAGLTFWTPNINIFRDPRWGRGQETYGEDPYLTARLGVMFVKGLQGDDPTYLKTAACAKHYAVHSGPEAIRHEFDARPSLKDFYETYLPAFKALVTEAHVEAVMGAYNRVYGEPACGSKFLLQDILRDSWGFEGHVVSDCWAIKDFHENHKVTADVSESAAKALNAGVNLNCGDSYPALKSALNRGLVTEKTIDERLKTLIKSRFKLGFFDPDELNPYFSIADSVVGCKKHRDLAYETAVKSIVLLKNDNNILPLDKEIKSLYVTGPFATSSEVLLGNYYGVSNHFVNLLEGITGKISAGTSLSYKSGCLPFTPNVNPMDWTTGEAKDADAMIVCLGISQQMEGEEGDAIASPSKGDRLDCGLPKNQLEFLRKLRVNNRKPIVVILTGGSPMTITEVDSLADAVLFAWYPGQEGGRAVADVVFGDVSPSGKLPVTFPKSLNQLPPFEDYSMQGRTYRYMAKEPLYPFGFGLSYGEFRYSDLALSAPVIRPDDSLMVLVKVTNFSDIKSDEVVQLYIEVPGAGKGQPFSSLRGFERITLDAGESQLVEFCLKSPDMVTYNEEGKANLVMGSYKIIVGGSSPGNRSKTLGAPASVEQVFKIE